MSDPPFRLQPLVDDENRHFWEGGRDGVLQFLACSACGHFIHPPAPVCPECLCRDCEVQRVSGRAQIYTFTINRHPWVPGFDPPYVVAIVELEEQAGLRLMTNIVHCPINEVYIGMPVEVCFEQLDDGAYLPLFQPASTS